MNETIENVMTKFDEIMVCSCSILIRFMYIIFILSHLPLYVHTIRIRLSPIILTIVVGFSRRAVPR